MTAGLCIGILAAGVVHVLPTDSFTLRWTHSVERTPWEEDFVVQGTALQLREARVTRSGAGMDPPPAATWSDGWWRYHPALGLLPEVILANSEFADGYVLCWHGGSCVSLDTVAAKGTPVKIAAMPCAARHASD